MKSLWFAVALALSLTACASVQQRPVTPPPVAQIVGIDPSLTIRCADLPIIGTSTLPMGGLVILVSSLQQMYNNCAIRNDKLIDAVKSITKDDSTHGNDKK